MSVKVAGVEDQGRSSININSRICIPLISMYERWLDPSFLALKWAKKSRNDFVEDLRYQDVEFGIMSFGLRLKA